MLFLERRLGRLLKKVKKGEAAVGMQGCCQLVYSYSMCMYYYYVIVRASFPSHNDVPTCMARRISYLCPA